MEDMRELLKGMFDIHIHTGPSVANRKVDIVQMARLAMDAGYRGFVAKDHYFPMAMGAKMVMDHYCQGKLEIYSCMALNNSVGAFNLNAIDVAKNLGVKIIYLPTLSSRQHIEEHKRSTVLPPFPGSGKLSVPEKPIYYLDEKGNLKEEVVRVLEYMAQNPDLVLSTGHGSPREIDAAIEKAVELGVKKIHIPHPYYCINAPISMIEKWAKLGCYVELNAGCSGGISPCGVVPMTEIAKVVEVVPMEQLVLVSDMGQHNAPDPVSGMLAYLPKLMEIGLTEADINRVGKINPVRLLGLEEKG